MNAKETIEKLYALLDSSDKAYTWESSLSGDQRDAVSDAISLLESMGKDGEMLDWLEKTGNVIYDHLEDGVHYLDASSSRDVTGDSLRECITTAMKKEAQA